MRMRRGMTILEVLVALAVMMVMTSVGWQTLKSTMEVRDFLAERDEATRGARVVLSTIRRELQLAFLTPQISAINTYYTVFVGEDEDPDRLFFASQSHQRLYRDTRESDQTEITLWLEPMPDGKRGSVLYHREAPRVDEEPAEDGVIYPLAFNVASLNFRYLDSVSAEWFDEWDSRSTDNLNALPRAVEVALVLYAPDPADPKDTIELPFFTTVILEYASPVTQSLFASGGGQ
jgi:general secretion pathway protein J